MNAPDHRSDEGKLAYVAIASIYLFAFFAPRSIAIGQLSQLVMLIVAVVFALRYRDAILRAPILWLGGAYVIYVLARGLWAALIGQPELASEHLDGTSSWVRAIALPIVILGLALLATGNWVRHAIGALIAVAAGLLLFEVLPAWSWGEFQDALTGRRRFIFGLGHSRSGFIMAAGLVALLAFMPLIIGRWPDKGGTLMKGLTGLRVALWAVLVIALLLAEFVTKTRTTWLALMVALLALGVVAAWHYRDHLLRKGTLIALACAAIVLGLALTQVWGELERRATDRAEAIQQILTMESLDDAFEMDDANVGARMAYKVFAITLWMERPLVGHGPADPYYLMQERPLPPVLEGRSGHFHDAHVEALSRLGLTGWLLIMAFLALLVIEALRRLGRPDTGDRRVHMLALTGISFTALLLVWMLGTHQLTRFQSVHIYAPFLAPMCAALFLRRLKPRREAR
ncbi:O-antigen ligase [Natronocella acetinitrilica]|uniref:O-antigen ligase n=1 Tax=Natronocella acetinitrilica TaxID=414046 RepID=A0AAE3KAX3_9GAMM|nr:O-antigen ligase family protein [Natronocella acetinitrilica]MCP1673956.1 O-antigen ligase [Natronocella acetinitrilica]